jgi:molybdate transport system regulatory protein
MEIKHKIWLEENGKVIFGQGRDELLKAIDECHSLHAAAKKLHMSYRAAWGRLKASEARLGIKLVETDAPGLGMHLTDTAKALVKKFDELESETSSFLERASRQLSFITKNNFPT